MGWKAWEIHIAQDTTSHEAAKPSLATYGLYYYETNIGATLHSRLHVVPIKNCKYCFSKGRVHTDTYFTFQQFWYKEGCFPLMYQWEAEGSSTDL